MRALSRAVAGALLWLVAVAVVPTNGPSAALFAAALVHVPLALTLVARVSTSRALGLARALALPAAIALVAGHALRAPIAALFALPWLGVAAACVAHIVVHRVMRRERIARASDAAIDAGLLFLAVAAASAVLALADAHPLGFATGWIELTAVHFHYAGLVLSVHVGVLARARPGRAIDACAIAMVAAVPLVAIGIVWSPLLEWLAAWALAVTGVAIAILTARAASSRRRRGARVLLRIAATSLAFAMVLAGAYALGSYLEVYWLTIDSMVVSHGLLNALGFGLPALVAWALDTPREPKRPPQAPPA